MPKIAYTYLYSLLREEYLLEQHYVVDGYLNSYAARVFKDHLARVRMEIATLRCFATEQLFEAVQVSFAFYLLEQNGWNVDDYAAGTWYNDYTEYESDLANRAVSQFNRTLDDIPF